MKTPYSDHLSRSCRNLPPPNQCITSLIDIYIILHYVGENFTQNGDEKPFIVKWIINNLNYYLLWIFYVNGI